MTPRGRAANALVAALVACAPPPPTPAPLSADTSVGTTTAASPLVERAPQPLPAFTPELERLWQRRITPRLKQDAWRTNNRYDAAAMFMIPLHAAFDRDYLEGQQQFADHVARFLDYRDSVTLEPAEQLSWLQYFYLLSRFSAVAATHDRADLVPPELPAALRRWVARFWQDEPAWQWYRNPFPGGVRERVEWKLSGARAIKGKSFEKVILDQELMLFAIAADLRRYGQAVGSELAEDPMLRDIDAYARRAYASRVAWTADSGWVFQPGIWRDHPDHQYQCRKDKLASIEPCRTVTGVDDASHGHRYPLLLRSMAEAQPPGSETHRFYQRLRWGLERQFFQRIAVAPSPEFAGWRMHNYMDGENGIYRWNFSTLGAGEGYGPYELSGTLLIGWWAFLPGERVRELFADLAARFPLGESQLALYNGPGRRSSKSPGLMGDGTAELLCRLAADLPRSLPDGS